MHSHRPLQPVRVCKEAKRAPCASILCALAWLLCDERALPSALAAVAASGADAARGAIAPLGPGFSHISSCGSRKPPRSQRAAAPLRRTRVGEAANPGPSAGKGTATHGDATAHDNGLVVQRDRAVEALARAGLPQCGLPPFPPLPLPAAEARAQASFPHSGLPPFPPLPPPAMPAEVADTISDTDSRVSELAYLTPRAADGTGTPPGQGCDGAIAPTAEASPSTPVPVQPLPEQHQALRHQVPPLTGRLPPTNSWLYMPLLLDGAGLLSPPAAEAWRSHAPYADTWPALVTTLVASAPVRATDLAAAVWSAAEADADPGGTTEDCGHVCSCLGAQPTACLTLRQAVSAAAGAHGYLTAATQSAFLQLFGGVTLAAEAAALADRARAFLQTAAPRAPRRRRGRAAAPPPAVPEASGDGIPAVDATTDAPQVMRGAIGRQAWQDLDNIDVQAELRQPVPTLQDVPPFLRAGVRRALVFALQAVRDADLGEGAGIGITPTRAWTLFMLTPRMLLARPGADGAVGRRLLHERVDRYERGDWPALLASLRGSPPHRPDGSRATEASDELRTCCLVRKGEVSRARHLLTGSALAPGDAGTWAALADPSKRPDRPRVPIPPDLLAFEPEHTASLSTSVVAQTLREARRGAAPGLSGARPEHFLELLAYAASALAKARVPPVVSAALALARMTALRKPDGGVRGIATGDVFRRLVSRALAKTWAATFDEATRPYQHALSARSGMDALVARLRVALETDPDVTVVSLDGRSAYDTVSRAAFLSKLRQVAPALLPFVRLFYGQPSVYCWWDDSGTCRDICQAEGCEQGDALAPALVSLAQHDGLERAAAELRPGEELLAYLDDLYVITSSARAKPALDVVATCVEEHCGIASNVGKTRIYNTTGGPAPCGVAELGEEVWRSDRPLPERGFTALGVPIGHCDHVREWGQRRLREEQALLDHLPHLRDLQCAWLLLLMCASTRATHALRNIPPEDVRPYAEGRDRAVCAALHECLGEPTVEGEPLASTAWAVAATLATQGGLGLQSAMRTAPAAYWGAWADARVLACTATALGGGMCAGTGARRSRPTCPQRGPCRCKPSAKRGMAGVPHLRNTPQHPMRSSACPGSRAWRLASRLAVPRIAYTLTLLPRSSATPLLGAGSPGAVAVPVGSPSRRVAHGHTHGQVHLGVARSHADRASQTSPYASAFGTRPLRPTWARMPKKVRPLGRPCARLHTQRPLGTPGEAG